MHRQLYEIVEREGIILRYDDLATTPDEILGLYYYSRRTLRPIIILDSRLRGRVAEHDSVLAEEVGHHITSPRISVVDAHACQGSWIIISQDERRAMEWACDILVPSDVLCSVVRNGRDSLWELAEYFEVTDWLMSYKLDMLRRRGWPRTSTAGA